MDIYLIKIMLRKSLILVVDQGTGFHLKVGGNCICPRKKEQRKQRVSVEKCSRLLELGDSLKGKQQL